MGNCKGKDSKQMVANTEQPTQEDDVNDKESEIKNNDVPIADVSELNNNKLEVIGKKVNIKAEIQATNTEPNDDNEKEPKLTESEQEELEENNSNDNVDNILKKNKEPKDEWVEILDPDQLRKEWIEKDQETVEATPNAEPENNEKQQNIAVHED